jgi:hypothetical protein
VQQLAVVRAEPAEQRQVVGPLEDVDAVDLQQAGPADDPPEVAPADRAVGRGSAKPWAASATRRAVASDSRCTRPPSPALGPVVDPTGRP